MGCGEPYTMNAQLGKKFRVGFNGRGNGPRAIHRPIINPRDVESIYRFWRQRGTPAAHAKVSSISATKQAAIFCSEKAHRDSGALIRGVKLFGRSTSHTCLSRGPVKLTNSKFVSFLALNK